MMNERTTWFLTALALVLFLFIVLVERRTPGTAPMPAAPPRLLSISASEVTNIQLRVTNQLLVKAERTNGGWHLTMPIQYPAQSERIHRLLELLEDLPSQRLITLPELTADKRTVADFGLDVPQISLTLHHGGRRSEMLIGAKTALGDQVYVQMLASPDIYVASSELLNRLPRQPTDWRDTALVSFSGLVIDHIEVRAPARGFALALNPTNRAFYLSKPTPARADGPRVDALLRTLALGQIARYVADGPVPDLEPYGLKPPVAELVFGLGTNDLVAIQFGKSPTNDPELVYARQVSASNLVLVSKALLDTLLTSHLELRDRHLLTFAPEAVDQIEVTGDPAVAVQRQTNGVWMALGPEPMTADPDLVREWLDRLSRLQGTVEKDVVTDFAPYGLTQPARQIILRQKSTGDDRGTNTVLAQVDLGAQQDGKVFVRRPDEAVAYSLAVDALQALPSGAWQLRDRRVFRFTTNQVVSVTIRQNGYERKLLRSPTGNWSLAPGSQGMINTFAVEDLVGRLGALQANAWVDRGDANRARYGFTDTGYRLTFELRIGDKSELHVLEFGKRAPSLAPLALTTLTDQTWVFEFPVALYYDLIRYLSNPPLSPTAASQAR